MASLSSLLGQSSQLAPSPDRSRLVSYLLQRSAAPAVSRSPIESINIAAQEIIPALLQRREMRAQAAQTAAARNALANYLGAPQPTQVTVADLPGSPGSTTTVPGYDSRPQIAALLAGMSPNAVQSMQSAVMSRLLSPVKHDIREGLPGEFVDLTNPSQPKVIRRAPAPPVSAPTTRTRNEGNETITEQFDPTTGKWQFVGSAPRFRPRPASAPTTRTRSEGGDVVTEEFNPATKKWDVVSRAPRFQNTPSVSRVTVPILKKLASGQQLTPGEQSVLDFVSRADALDRLLSQQLAGFGAGTAAPNTAPATGNVGPAEREQVINDARAAIAQGADRPAVAARLRSMGVDPTQAGL